MRSQSQARKDARPQGSYYSSGPAGGRPASGLSRRRTQFRGPPTSFYRGGGWGEHSAKRAAAQGNSAPRAERPVDDAMGGGGYGSGGMGPGQKPWGHGNDVPHFDKEGHFGTQEYIDARRRQRRRMTEDGKAKEEYQSGRGMGLLGQFVVIGGIVVVAVYGPGLVIQGDEPPRRKKR